MNLPAHPTPGSELDWLACDEVGHVALFSTGGQGPVPRVVAEHLAVVETAIERLPTLPILGPCAEAPRGPGTFDFWTEPSRRGIFGYDWGPVPNPPFARITVPSRFLMVDRIEDEVVRTAAMLVRLDLDFIHVTAIFPTQLGIDLNGLDDPAEWGRKSPWL